MRRTRSSPIPTSESATMNLGLTGNPALTLLHRRVGSRPAASGTSATYLEQEGEALPVSAISLKPYSAEWAAAEARGQGPHLPCGARTLTQSCHSGLSKHTTARHAASVCNQPKYARNAMARAKSEETSARPAEGRVWLAALAA